MRDMIQHRNDVLVFCLRAWLSQSRAQAFFNFCSVESQA